jgi:DNA polymerase-3 subunit delta'
MVRGQAPPHAILLTGPDRVGKTTLALDLAAGLLCEAEPERRPCRACGGCRMVDKGAHPDLHRLGPVGPGRQVIIGGPKSKDRGVLDLIADLKLRPIQGGVRVALIERAERMNEDAQSALLKTLEEPAPGVVIILCADSETKLEATIRSRCARIRLGLVGSRDIEAVVADHDLADPPLAARLGRISAGRPGLALAYARRPEAVLIRAELSRVMLDLTDAGPAARLAAVRAALPRAMALVAALAASDQVSPGARPTRTRGAVRALATPVTTDEPEEGEGDDPDEGSKKGPPAVERRRGAELLIALWTDVARDLALVGDGGGSSVRDSVLLEELAAIATNVDPDAVVRFLGRAARSGELLASNVSPELLLDSLVLAWPRRLAAA